MLTQLGKRAKKAERVLMTASSEQKNKALGFIAEALIENAEYIAEENKKDIASAREKGMSESMLDRLMLDEKRIRGISDAARELIENRSL